MNIKSKGLAVLIDIIAIVLIVAFGIFLRIPADNSIGSAQLNNELTDTDCYYLSDPDSYLYARKAREFSQDLRGFSFVNTRTEDYTMNPVSTRENGLVTNGLPFLAALIFRFLNIFSDITIEMIVYYLNAVICSLAVIPAYLYVKKQTNIIGGIVAGMLAVISIPFLEHSVAGYFDTDAMLCTVPLCLMCCFALMIQSDEFKKKMVYAVLSVLFFAILASTWETFYIYFGILVFLSVITIIILRFVSGDGGRLPYQRLLHEIAFIGGTILVMIVVAILMYGSTIFDSIRRLITNMVVTNDYPDPTKYIVELSPIPLLSDGASGAFLTTGSGIINKLGGVIVLAVAFISIILILFVRRRENVKFYACNTSFVAVWFLITLPFLIVGARFLELVCLPLSLLVGLGVGILAEVIINMPNKIIGYIVSVFLAVFVLFGPFAGVMIRSNSPSPFYNKTFNEACRWINSFSGENADIMTWWDYGYFIQYASARHVLADGGTFDGRYFYFLAHALLTDDADLSVGIFNMLDFSGVDALDVAEEYLPDSKTACEALIDILPVNRLGATAILMTKYKLTEDVANEIINVAKPDTIDERYLIISRDLITKIGALSYYGFYDFDDETPGASLGVSTEPVIASIFEETVDIRGIDNMHVVIKQADNNEYVTLIDDAGNPIDISRIIYVENGERIRDEDKGTDGYTLYCINDDNEYSFIVCSDTIADSMLVSLMALDHNDCYTRVYSSVMGDNLTSSDSVTSRFFGDSSTPDNAGSYVYKVIQ